MNSGAQHSRFTQSPKLKRLHLKVRPIIHRQFALQRNGRIDDRLRLAMPQGNRLLEKDMTPGFKSLASKREMGLRRSCNMEDVRPFRFEHFSQVGISARNSKTDRQLLRHDRFEITGGNQLY